MNVFYIKQILQSEPLFLVIICLVNFCYLLYLYTQDAVMWEN